MFRSLIDLIRYVIKPAAQEEGQAMTEYVIVTLMAVVLAFVINQLLVTALNNFYTYVSVWLCLPFP